jgi:hypothetical protein
VKNGPGFGYGFVVAWAFVMAFFTLMCGLVIEGFKNVVAGELETRKCLLAQVLCQDASGFMSL